MTATQGMKKAPREGADFRDDVKDSGIEFTKVDYKKLAQIKQNLPDISALESAGWSHDVRRDSSLKGGRRAAEYTLVWRSVDRKTAQKLLPYASKVKGNQSKTAGHPMGVIVPHGYPLGTMTPSTPPASGGGVGGSSQTSQTVSFSSLESVRAMQTQRRQACVVGYDTEFWYCDDLRVVSSYQFVLLDPSDEGRCVEVVALPHTGTPIRLTSLLGDVLDVSGLSAKAYGCDAGAPRVLRVDCASDKGWWDECFGLKASVCLVSHFGQADLTAFMPEDLSAGRARPWHKDLLRRLNKAGGGLVTNTPVRVLARGGHKMAVRPVSLYIRDTMSLAPAKSSLAMLGETIGVEKLDTGAYFKAHMNEYRDKRLIEFLDYGTNDSHICLEYVASQWGDGIVPPVTASTAGANAVKKHIKKCFGDLDNAGFRALFQGLEVRPSGKFASCEDGSLTFLRGTNYEPLNNDAERLQRAATEAYAGGLNSSDFIGFHRAKAFDFDLQSAYPTAMSLVLDPDWLFGWVEALDAELLDEDVDPVVTGVIDRLERNKWLTPDDVPAINSPVFACVDRFEFPDDVLWPSILTRVDGVPIYTQTSEHSHERWVAAPELFAGLRLGAKVHASEIITYRVLKGKDGKPAYMLRHALAQLVADRGVAKRVFGKGSIEEQLLKLAVNGTYGKLAQGVAGGRVWDSYGQEMEDLGMSAVTSPVHAAMTTSLVRAVLLITMNQLHDKGYKTYSVTTDGFISNAPEHVVTSLDLFGALPLLEESRIALTGDPAVWEIKHTQDTFFNGSTRCNVAANEGGVFARGGWKNDTDIPSNTPEERAFFLDMLCTRTSKIENTYTVFPAWSALSSTEDRADFTPKPVTTHKRMDYDMKRQPVQEALTPATYTDADGVDWEVACVATKPWRTVEDYARARSYLKDMHEDAVLRDVDDWHNFLFKMRYSNQNRRITSWQATLLTSVLVYLRRGDISVPALDNLTVKEKCQALSCLGLGTVTENLWKNVRRPERVGQAVPQADRLLRRLVSFLATWDGSSAWEPNSHKGMTPKERAA